MQRIITAEEVFHFSEVGSGKTKVILPLLCQAFLSNNAETHHHLARGGQPKHVLVVMVPEHLVADARTQVFRYCFNLNFCEEYRVLIASFALGAPTRPPGFSCQLPRPGLSVSRRLMPSAPDGSARRSA